ncbi:ParB/RepB/Spo0J family partition protein [Salipiger marinus]|uniref:ParB/RepB/Spo0J family partition protein n=1 Tax=Salipiger marinus TaxID=555512 RepID=UPI0040598234
MATPRLMQKSHVPVALVDASKRLRPVSEAGVESLMASIAEVGVMKDAIHVRQKKDGSLVLIAGGHRLETAKRLGWDEIEAKVWADVTDDWALLMEIDDNLAGAEMNALDTAVFLAERKRVYEKLHPETRAGVAGAMRKNCATDMMSVASFATSTAEKFGLTDRHVRRLIAVGTALEGEEIRLLRSAPRPVTLADLTELSKIGEMAERRQVVLKLFGGGAKSAAEARKTIAREEGRPGSGHVDPNEKFFDNLVSAWLRAPAVVRRRFKEEFARELQDAATLAEVAAE